MDKSIQNSVGLIGYNPRSSYRGYTLFCATGGNNAYLIDMEGRICKRWEQEQGIQYARLLDNGNLLCRASAPTEVQGQRGLNGMASAVYELDWDGNVVWEYRDDWLHHDSLRMPNGNTLVIKWEKLSEELTQQIKGGVHSEDDEKQMLGDVILEIAPDGTTVRRWNSWEHLDVEEDVICPLEHRLEWTHLNSLDLTPDGDWLISLRRIDTVAIVDADTGGFKWKWGPGVINHQHHATYLDNGHVMLFDNGPHRQGPSYSQVVEVDRETNEIVWDYKGDPILSFFSFMLSSADRLPNGNTLICEGASGHIFEVTPNKEVVWEYINPFFSKNPRFGDNINFLFRAHRYGPDHPALQGKDLDPGRYASHNILYASR